MECPKCKGWIDTNSTIASHHECPKPVAPSLSESEKFFAHLNNGEVSLEPTFTNLVSEDGLVQRKGFRVLITPKKEG